VVLLLDFSKAFDHLSWPFLEGVLQAKGFSDLWIAWMRTIYSEGSTSVLVNGAPTPSFKLERGVRQGCPLAPYLYILAHDALAHTLDGSSRDIQGLMLPNRKAISNLSFADEPSLYLLGTNDNLNRAKLALDAKSMASGPPHALVPSIGAPNWVFIGSPLEATPPTSTSQSASNYPSKSETKPPSPVSP
jgi:hypothetical protein